jgi:hypothetical protein
MNSMPALSNARRSAASLASVTGRLTFAPAGLIPAEHTSLRWTHKRTQKYLFEGCKRCDRVCSASGNHQVRAFRRKIKTSIAVAAFCCQFI